MKIITICQRKGGVGKSTSTLNLAAVLAESGYKVLVADLDDQQNTTSSISGNLQTQLTIADVLLEKADVNEAVVQTEWEGVSMLAASANLSGVGKHLDGEVGGHLVLKEKLQQVRDVDYILIDTSPSLNILVINAFCASEYLFVPLSSKFFSLQGLSQTLGAFNKAKTRLNPNLALLGMAFIIHDKRNALANEIVDKVRAEYPSYLFDTLVGINIKVEEAQVKRQPILCYAPDDRGSEQYRQLGAEIVARINRLEPVGANHG